MRPVTLDVDLDDVGCAVEAKMLSGPAYRQSRKATQPSMRPTDYPPKSLYKYRSEKSRAPNDSPPVLWYWQMTTEVWDLQGSTHRQCTDALPGGPGASWAAARKQRTAVAAGNGSGNHVLRGERQWGRSFTQCESDPVPHHSRLSGRSSPLGRGQGCSLKAGRAQDVHHLEHQVGLGTQSRQ